MRQLMMGCIAASLQSGFTSTDFTYTGTYTWVDDGSGNWRLKFLTSGTFTPLKNVIVDIFFLGGGAGGGDSNGYASGGGGGSGRTGQWNSTSLYANTAYTITIGAGGAAQGSGGSTSFVGGILNGSVLGGDAITSGQEFKGSNGGSGGGTGTNTSTTVVGAGGSNGSNGGSGSYAGGAGQGTNTYEFGDSSLTLYAGAGGAGAFGGSGGSGGSGGGGNGASGYSTAGGTASPNTGGGGGGASRGKTTSSGGSAGGLGGSGIVIIRNKR